MAEWVVAYCRKSVGNLTPDEMLKELRMADLLTLGENLDLTTSTIKEAEKQLRFEKEKRDPDFSYVDLQFKTDGRPIQIRRNTKPKTELDETLENLPEAKEAGLERVRKHLSETVEIVSFELGGTDSQGVGAILAEVTAFFIAQHGDGIVEFYGMEWCDPKDRGDCIWKR